MALHENLYMMLQKLKLTKFWGELDTLYNIENTCCLLDAIYI